jgi:acetyl esterase
MEPALERMTARMAARAPMGSLPVSAMRARAREDFAALNVDPQPIAKVFDATVPGAFRDNSIRIYDAVGDRTDAPGLVYFHGGGWIVGDLDTEDAKLRRLAVESGVRIVSVDYVLAPEHKFPDPVVDCAESIKWIHGNAPAFGLDRDRLAVGGASAGANLALAAAISLRDQGLALLRFLVFFYGVFDAASEAPSRSLFAEGYGMGADAMEFFYALYLKAEERAHPLASPVRAALAGLPPAYVNSAGLDVLRDDSRMLAEKLEEAGVPVQFEETPGVIHGYTLLAHEVGAARRAIENAAHALRLALE